MTIFNDPYLDKYLISFASIQVIISLIRISRSYHELIINDERYTKLLRCRPKNISENDHCHDRNGREIFYSRPKLNLYDICAETDFQIFCWYINSYGYPEFGYDEDYAIVNSIKSGDLKLISYLVGDKVMVDYSIDLVGIFNIVNDSIEYGYINVADYLMKHGGRITNGQHLMENRLKNGDLKGVKFLEKNGYTIEDYHLIYACEKGDIDILQYVVEKCKDISTYGKEALDNAVECNNVIALDYLINHVVDIDEEDISVTLKTSSKNGFLEIIRYLIESKRTTIDSLASTLSTSSKHGHFEIVRYLVKLGVDIHANNEKALGKAILASHFDIVRYLIECSTSQHGFINCNNNGKKSRIKDIVLLAIISIVKNPRINDDIRDYLCSLDYDDN
jgi:hypothetical protein